MLSHVWIEACGKCRDWLDLCLNRWVELALKRQVWALDAAEVGSDRLGSVMDTRNLQVAQCPHGTCSQYKPVRCIMVDFIYMDNVHAAIVPRIHVYAPSATV